MLIPMSQSSRWLNCRSSPRPSWLPSPRPSWLPESQTELTSESQTKGWLERQVKLTGETETKVTSQIDPKFRWMMKSKSSCQSSREESKRSEEKNWISAVYRRVPPLSTVFWYYIKEQMYTHLGFVFKSHLFKNSLEGATKLYFVCVYRHFLEMKTKYTHINWNEHFSKTR